jgi:glycosyltransferase involved in cell wall biosynthesis
MTPLDANHVLRNPLISIVTPVYNTPIKILKECIESVRAQTYENWELCLVDDNSPNAECRRVIQKYADIDSRIKCHYRKENGGIVAASNDARLLATGQFVGLLDHDDVIEPDAIEHVMKVFVQDTEVDYIYTDEDLLDENGKLYAPFRKPDWSPERFRNQMYVCHFSVMRRSLIDEVDWFRDGFDGSQDYDLILRITEKARKIHHIPIILYHWRISSTSVASNPYAKPYAYDAGERAISDHLTRVGITASVERRHDLPGNYHIRRTSSYLQQIDILLTGQEHAVNYWGFHTGSFELTKWNLSKHSTFRNLKIKDFPVTTDNACALANRFISQSESEFVVMCADGIVLSTSGATSSHDWCNTFLGFMQSPDIALVGGYTWTPGARLKHSSFSLGPEEMWVDGLRIGMHGTGQRAVFRCDREVSALFPYFAMIRTAHFVELGGLETSLEPLWAWVDLCLRFQDRGLKIVTTPQVNTYHFADDSEVVDPSIAGIQVDTEIAQRWSQIIARDPYTVFRPEQRVHRKPRWKPRH